MPLKRKAQAVNSGDGVHGNGTSTKRQRTTSASPSLPDTNLPTDPLRAPHPFYKESEDNGIVLRKYYPREMSNDRARAYNANELPRPIEVLNAALAGTAEHRRSVKVRAAVVHWFKWDLRLNDNRALAQASDMAQRAGVPLIGLFVISPQDFEAHLTAPIRIDFMLRSLEVLKEDLAKLDIPLWVETVEERRNVPTRIVELMEEWRASHLFANLEYEVDELRREAKLARLLPESDMALHLAHDTCVVPPGPLKSGTGKPYAVYTPWFRAWTRHLTTNPELLEPSEVPQPNPPTTRTAFSSLFTCPIPPAPSCKRLPPSSGQKFLSLWPAGEHEATKRLAKFCTQNITSYAKNRNIPSLPGGTANLSVHFACGTLSARTAVRTAQSLPHNEGIETWISEVAWRDFYKHVLVHWPYICMNKPFKPEYSNIQWSYNQEHFRAWCEGRTGYPIVDAAMRQLREIGWMHNRCRMIVASFLSKDLLLDWRMGERFFMEHLIDGDFASNNGGWGFSASVGVDPQPYFRVFNPLLQSEKFDPEGEYIRKWVPELRGVKGKAVHDPYGRGAEKEAGKGGYPRMVVEHKGARERALKAYKSGIESGL